MARICRGDRRPLPAQTTKPPCRGLKHLSMAAGHCTGDRPKSAHVPASTSSDHPANPRGSVGCDCPRSSGYRSPHTRRSHIGGHHRHFRSDACLGRRSSHCFGRSIRTCDAEGILQPQRGSTKRKRGRLSRSHDCVLATGQSSSAQVLNQSSSPPEVRQMISPSLIAQSGHSSFSHPSSTSRRHSRLPVHRYWKHAKAKSSS